MFFFSNNNIIINYAIPKNVKNQEVSFIKILANTQRKTPAQCPPIEPIGFSGERICADK